VGEQYHVLQEQTKELVFFMIGTERPVIVQHMTSDGDALRGKVACAPDQLSNMHWIFFYNLYEGKTPLSCLYQSSEKLSTTANYQIVLQFRRSNPVLLDLLNQQA
jgi:hypothetical protein